MFIEHYNIYIANNTTKRVKKISIHADDAQSAHKKAFVNTHAFTEDITKITNSQGEIVYTLKDGFIELV